MATSPPANPFTPPPGAAATNQGDALVLHDIKPPVPIVNLWPYALAALSIALLVSLLLAWLLRQRRRQRLNPPALPLIPPHRRASDALHAALSLLHDPKTFVTLVADALRIYLEERFQLHAPERTTEEFLQELPACTALDSRQTGLLADFLRHCDLVKFARQEPTEPELRGLWQTAHRLVVETSPPFDEPQENRPSYLQTPNTQRYAMPDSILPGARPQTAIALPPNAEPPRPESR